MLGSAQFIGGTSVTELEEELARFAGVPHVMVCSSGTDALLLALMALDIGPEDEVITTPYSFIATAEVIGLLRARTVFVDVDPATYNLDPALVEAKITTHTKAIIPVSLFGQTAEMDAINAIAAKHGISVIEDAAQSFGARHGDTRSGNLSPLAATSFFPAKPLGCYGDGGAVFSQDENLAKKIRMLLNHGQTARYYHDYIGINGRLDSLQAAVLKVKLAHLDDELVARNRIADFYNTYLNRTLYTPQHLSTSVKRMSAYAQYCVTINHGAEDGSTREQVIAELSQAGIPTAMYYPVPLHLQKPFRAGYKPGDFPVSERLSKSMFAIPIDPFLSKAEQQQVVDAMNGVSLSTLSNS